MNMAKKSARELNKELFDKVASIRLHQDIAAIYGTTSRESMLQELRKHVAQLGEALASNQSYEHIMECYEAVVGSIDSAGVTGLISETEISDYYSLVDNLWAAIEKEQK